jgi:hypothetical protein
MMMMTQQQPCYVYYLYSETAKTPALRWCLSDKLNWNNEFAYLLYQPCKYAFALANFLLFTTVAAAAEPHGDGSMN